MGVACYAPRRPHMPIFLPENPCGMKKRRGSSTNHGFAISLYNLKHFTLVHNYCVTFYVFISYIPARLPPRITAKTSRAAGYNLACIYPEGY